VLLARRRPFELSNPESVGPQVWALLIAAGAVLITAAYEKTRLTSAPLRSAAPHPVHPHRRRLLRSDLLRDVSKGRGPACASGVDIRADLHVAVSVCDSSHVVLNQPRTRQPQTISPFKHQRKTVPLHNRRYSEARPYIVNVSGAASGATFPATERLCTPHSPMWAGPRGRAGPLALQVRSAGAARQTTLTHLDQIHIREFRRLCWFNDAATTAVSGPVFDWRRPEDSAGVRSRRIRPGPTRWTAAAAPAGAACAVDFRAPYLVLLARSDQCPATNDPGIARSQSGPLAAHPVSGRPEPCNCWSTRG